jgi:hypothetical protein
MSADEIEELSVGDGEAPVPVGEAELDNLEEESADMDQSHDLEGTALPVSENLESRPVNGETYASESENRNWSKKKRKRH